MAPQIIYITIALIGIGVSVSRHGTPNKGKRNAIVEITASAITWGLLYWGGFFNVFFK